MDERARGTSELERSSRRTRIALAALVIPGIVLRLLWLDWMEFAGDELSIVYDAYRAVHERFALHGIPASIGVRLPSGLLYLVAVPMAWTRDPVAIAYFVALLNLVGLWFFFACVRRSLGTNAALLATALLASAPWPVLFARKIWNPDFLFPFAAALYAALAGLLASAAPTMRARFWKSAVAVLAYAALCQFHASAWILAVPLITWAFVFRVPFDRRGVIVGLALGLLLWMPYLVYLVSSRGDDFMYAWNLRGSLPRGATSSSIASSIGGHVQRALQTSTGLGFEGEISALEGGAEARLLGWLCTACVWGFFAAIAVATAWGIGRSTAVWARALRGERFTGADAMSALFAAIFVAVLAVYLLAGFRPLYHYYAILIPLPLYFAVHLAVRVWTRRAPLAPMAPFVALPIVVGHACVLTAFLLGLRTGRVSTAVPSALPYAPFAEKWQQELQPLFEEVDTQRAAWRAEQERQRALFDAADDVLVRFDPASNSPPAIAQGRVTLEPTPDGLVVRDSTPVDMLRLPAFDNEGGGRVCIRLELELPKDGLLLVFHETARSGGYARAQTVSVRVARGENLIFLELPDEDACGRIMLRADAWRYVVRSFEVRRRPR